MFNIKALELKLNALGAGNNLFVAYSGGLDSQVLLDALVKLRALNSKLKITAIHVDHNLSPNARIWSEHCQKICKKLGVSLVARKVDARIDARSGLSQEAVARDLRYEVMQKLLKKGDCLLTAHHADDQAETLLLQLFRGAGPKGLSAMPEKIPFGKAILLRPFLTFSRSELHVYARKNLLPWINDESNTDIKFDRNYIRHKVMPLIKKRWPGILITSARVARHSAEASELLKELAEGDYLKVIGAKANTLSISKLCLLSDARQRNVIRYWFHILHLPTPSSAKLSDIQKNVLLSRRDAMPKVSWQGAEVCRFRDNIYAFEPIKAITDNLILPWSNLHKPLKLPGTLGMLSCKISSEDKKLFTKLKNKITVRFRCGGERCKLPHRTGTHELKKLFQEWQIPTWQRNFIPLIYYGDEMLAVVGYANCISSIIDLHKKISFEIKQIFPKSRLLNQ
jgi:tRNA(Ile)-lysidine synthase